MLETSICKKCKNRNSGGANESVEAGTFDLPEDESLEGLEGLGPRG